MLHDIDVRVYTYMLMKHARTRARARVFVENTLSRVVVVCWREKDSNNGPLPILNLGRMGKSVVGQARKVVRVCNGLVVLLGCLNRKSTNTNKNNKENTKVKRILMTSSCSGNTWRCRIEDRHGKDTSQSKLRRVKLRPVFGRSKRGCGGKCTPIHIGAQTYHHILHTHRHEGSTRARRAFRCCLHVAKWKALPPVAVLSGEVLGSNGSRRLQGCRKSIPKGDMVLGTWGSGK